MSFSKRLYKKRRKKNPNGLISEHAQPGKIQSRYIDFTPFRYFSVPKPKIVEQQDCTVHLSGSSCSLSTGEVTVISRNEPTEPLKNMNKAIHSRFVPNVPIFYHDPKYGGWDNPYKFRNKPQKKVKKFEYY